MRVETRGGERERGREIANRPLELVVEIGIESERTVTGLGKPHDVGVQPQHGCCRPGLSPPHPDGHGRKAAPAAAPAAAAAPTPEPPPPEPTQGSATGLPLPRFVPLRSDRVNLRVGPDTRFPIEWRYERRDLPVQIIREHEQWRRIRDIDGTEGWVHQSNLTPNRRTFLVRSNPAGEVVMRRGEQGNELFVIDRGDVVGDTLFYGRGAGQDPTSSSVIADLAEAAAALQSPRSNCFATKPKNAVFASNFGR
jgi:SH3-like domain-containing protein